MEIDAGGDHTVILLPGHLVGWGDNSFGQTKPPDHLPPDLSRISTGPTHTLAIGPGEFAYAWGDTSYGKCDVPIALGGYWEVSAGRDHSWGISDGSVLAWGSNEHGQCDIPDSAGPYVDIDGGLGHSIALRPSGMLCVWGLDAYGLCEEPNPEDHFSVCRAYGFLALGLDAEESMHVPEHWSRWSAAELAVLNSPALPGSPLLLRCRAARTGAAWLELFDAEGRLLSRFDLGLLGPGTPLVELGPASREWASAGSGCRFIRLATASGTTRAVRVVYLR